MKNAFECSGSSPGLSQAELLFIRLTNTTFRNSQPNVSDSPQVDFGFEPHGSLFLLKPLTRAAFSFVETYLEPRDQPFFPSVILVEPRFCDGLVDAIEQFGLEVL